MPIMVKMGFVHVRGVELRLEDGPFYFAGANCHYLLTHSADETQRRLVTEVLDDAKHLNLTVLRCWAFCDGPDEWNALQPEPGKFNENVLVGLDWLVAEAGRRGLRLLLALTNYWPDYGGMPAYVRWRHGILDRTQHDYKVHPTSLFYTDPRCQALFRRAVSTVVGRVNSLTGVPYAEDPAILGWELANEPRCEAPGGDRVLQKWVTSTADFVRTLDPNHLVTVGLEGFFGPSTPALLSHNPYDSAARHGADFMAVFGHPSLDFASIHLYPDQWRGLDSSASELRTFMRDWIQSHAAVCAGPRLRKPLVVSEFGKRDPDRYHGRDCTYNLDREQAFKEVLDTCRDLAAGGSPLAGVCAWMLAARQYPDYDGYTLRLGPPAPESAPLGSSEDDHTAALASGQAPHTPGRMSTPGASEPAGPAQSVEGSAASEEAHPSTEAAGCKGACGSAGPFGGSGVATGTYPPPQVEEPAVQLLRQFGAAMAELSARAAAGPAAEGGGAGGGVGRAQRQERSCGGLEGVSGSAARRGGGGSVLGGLLGRCCGWGPHGEPATSS